MASAPTDVDVVVIGSGFGGSVAALRFAEAGERVCVLERGDWATRENFQADFDLFWFPDRNAFGINDIQTRGDSILTWTGAGVGGGSLVFAGALLRLENFDSYPSAITAAELRPYYELVERMLSATPYPDYEPYSDVPIVRLFMDAGAKLEAQQHPELEGWGGLNLGISFAPPGVEPGSAFVNEHGAPQSYSDPYEMGMLGGDLDTKNSLDRNYLFLAQKVANNPVEIRPLHEADRIVQQADGSYRVFFRRYVRDDKVPRRWLRRLLPKALRRNYQEGSLSARRVVVAAGAIGSSELLLKNRDLHGTLKGLSGALGERYSTNGDYLMLMVPWRGAVVPWLSFLAGVVFALKGKRLPALVSSLTYFASSWYGARPFAPDVGNNNSTFLRFKDDRGGPQGAYIECGRYPTPAKMLAALGLSAVGLYRPVVYRSFTVIGRVLQLLVPPFGAVARSWPVPLLTMGRDDAFGRMSLDKDGKLQIDYDAAANQRFYAYLQRLGRSVAGAAKCIWLPHVVLLMFRRFEVPHNQGGVPMGQSASEGVVDHAGRVFGMKNLMVLDGSILPSSPGPNPALTIAALAERAMHIVRTQIAGGGDITPDE